MKESKKLFSIIAIAVVVICAVVMLIRRSHSIITVTDYTEGTYYQIMPEDGIVDISKDPKPAPQPTEPATNNTPTIPDNASEITAGKNVRIYKVPKDPNEQIDRDINIPADHPELTDAEEGGYFFSAEGKVYRNDRVISIDVYDDLQEITRTISFGYITGKCNRFLYLNPIVEDNDCQYSFRFQEYQSDTQIGGTVEVISPEEVDLSSPSFVTYVAIDQKIEALYKDPNYPGVVWYTSGALEEPVYISCQVLTAAGEPVALLRLVITKDPEDGTYSFSDIINCNIMQENPDNSIIPDSDIKVLYELACDTLYTPEKTGLHWMQASGRHFDPTEFMMEVRDYHTGMYHQQYYPKGIGTTRPAYKDLCSPVVAVTYREFSILHSLTMYFRVVRPATHNEPAVYEYIGRDSARYSTLEEMQSNGYIGSR